MTDKLQILWYLKKDDFTNYCIDFRPYKNKKIEGYEISEVDEDLIYDLTDKNPDKLEVLGFFRSENELKKHIKNSIENNNNDLSSTELDKKTSKAYDAIEWSGEDYYISAGDDKLGSDSNKILNWYDALKEDYADSLGLWILWITGYDVFDLKCGGKVLTYVLSDIFNLPESYFDEMIPNKGIISINEWNRVIEKMEKKYHFKTGLKRTI